MTTGIGEIRDALARTVRDTTGLRTTPYWTDIASVPCALIRRSGGRPRTDYGKTSPAYQFTIMLLFARANEVDAQKSIDKWLSRGTGTSLWDALEADRTLGGVAHTLQLDDDTNGDGVIEIGGVDYIAAPCVVTVYPQ